MPERSEEPDIVLRLDMVICLADRPAQPLSGAATVRLRTLSRQATPTPPPADRRKARAAYRVATCSLGATCSLLIQSPVLRRPCDRAKRLDLLYAKVKGAQPIGPFCGRHQGQPSAGAYAKSSVRHWREQAQGAQGVRRQKFHGHRLRATTRWGQSSADRAARAPPQFAGVGAFSPSAQG